MGYSTIPKYAVIIDDGMTLISMPWDCRRHGRPNAQTLEKYVLTYGDSLNPGKVNAHIRAKDGTIPYPRKAFVKFNRAGGETVATWQAPMFMVW